MNQLLGFSSSSLPQATIRILDADAVCAGPLALFSENGDTTAHIVAEDADQLRDQRGGSTDPQQEFGDARPVFSPDGTHIAFESNRSGRTYNIWLMDREGEYLVFCIVDSAIGACKLSRRHSSGEGFV